MLCLHDWHRGGDIGEHPRGTKVRRSRAARPDCLVRQNGRPSWYPARDFDSDIGAHYGSRLCPLVPDAQALHHPATLTSVAMQYSHCDPLL
ncbi:hypothetical protein U1Q18_044748 [Sarracenia purpurea var. burkii]